MNKKITTIQNHTKSLQEQLYHEFMTNKIYYLLNQSASCKDKPSWKMTETPEKKKTDDRNFWSPTIHISTFGALHWSIIACHASTLLHYQFHRHAFILLGISHNIQKATVWFVIQNYSRAWLSTKHKAFRTDKPALQSQA